MEEWLPTKLTLHLMRRWIALKVQYQYGRVFANEGTPPSMHRWIALQAQLGISKETIIFLLLEPLSLLEISIIKLSQTLTGFTHQCVHSVTYAVGLDPLQVWEKNGQHYLTLGLYVDLNEDNLSAEDLAEGVLPMADDPAFVLPDRIPTADIFADKVRLALS